jgi:hypothetical protein
MSTSDQIKLILKMLIPSALISIAIKYLAPNLAIAPTSSHALIGVLFPPIAMTIALIWSAKSKPALTTDRITRNS